MIRKTAVTIGEPPSPAFPAWVKDGENWNGWAVPYFARETADAVMAWANDADGSPTVIRFMNVYLVSDTDAPPYPDIPHVVQPVTLALDNGGVVTTWALGGHSWTWEEVTGMFTIYAEDGEYGETAPAAAQALAQFAGKHPDLFVSAVVSDDMRPPLVPEDSGSEPAAVVRLNGQLVITVYRRGRDWNVYANAMRTDSRVTASAGNPAGSKEVTYPS